MSRSGVRPFEMRRVVDRNGVSGTGLVAVGAVMPTGAVALTWVTHWTSKVWFDSLDDVRAVHLHPGTTITFDDDPENPLTREV